MKKILIIFTVVVSSFSFAIAQEKTTSVLPLIGESAPSFTAQSTNGDIRFPEDYLKSWTVIFCHPADFTPVCSSEILELAALQQDFKKMNANIIVVSTDSKENHKEWVKSLQSLEYKNRKSGDINFPLVDDQNHAIAHKYGMIHPANNSTKDVRGVFIVDPESKIAAMFFYPMNVGRNIDEIKRTILALQTARKDQVMTPANWTAGGDVFVPYLKKTAESQEEAKKEDPNLHMVSWYMWMKKSQ